MSRPDTDHFRQLFVNDTPLMDVRAPVEYARGSFPHAINAPLMTDEERHRVGICYKENGQAAAILLGHHLVSGDIRAERIAAWKRFALDHPDGYLFCYRGGMRSQIVQQWLQEAGLDYPRIQGGYKALRRFLIETLDDVVRTGAFYILSGRTGTGKTRVLQDMPNPVDLEHLANHRGSSFGRQVTPQPSQIDFENALAIALLKAAVRGGPICLEDESRLVGRCALPLDLRERMSSASMLILQRPLAERVDMIRGDYVDDMVLAYRQRDGDLAGWENFRDYLLSALERIRRRLGGERYQHLRQLMETALEHQGQTGLTDAHNQWIRALLTDYYDPMYDYQLSHKSGRIVATGGPEDLVNWATTRR